jgi:hypothetical protein
MRSRVRPDDRSLTELLSLLVVCRECGDRKRLTCEALGVICQEGTRTLGMLRKRAVCYTCEYGGLNHRNLRFHPEWKGTEPPVAPGHPANDNRIGSVASDSVRPFWG